MEAKTYTVINPGNTVASGNSVYFYESGTSQTILASVYGSNVQSNPLTQPLSTDSGGQVSAYLPNGVYDIKLVQTSGLVQLIQDVLYNDPEDSTFELNAVVNEGTGVGIFDKIIGSSINLKSLVAGGNVQLSDIGNGNIVISANPSTVNGIVAGQNIQVSTNSGVVTISSPNGGTVTGGSSDGSGVSVYSPVSSTSTNLHFKSLVGGNNVAVSDNGVGGIVISTVIPSGTVVGGFSEGSGVAVFDAPHSTSSQLAFRTLAAGANISITQQNDGTLTVSSIAGTGTVTEAVNEGAGVPVFDYENSTATTLAFKSIAAGSNVEISDSGNGTIFVNSTNTGGTVVGAVSVGSGDPLYDSSLSDASTIAIKSIATSGIVTHTDANGLLTISGQAIQSGVSEGIGVSVLDSTNSTSSQLKFKSIAAGENVSVVDNGSGTVTIASSNPGGTVVGAETRGTGVAVWDFSATTAQVLAFKTLHGSSNLNIVDDGDGNITLSALTGGSVLGGESVGTGNAVYDASASSSSTIAIKSVAAGSNVTIVDNGAGTLTFNSTASGSLTGAENVGTGTGLFDSSASSSSTLAFKSIAAGSNITVTDNGTGTVTLSSTASGGVTSASSEGSGVPVFDSANSTSSNLAFRSIKQGTWTSVTNDGSGDVVVDVPDVTVITMSSEGTGISILDAASTATNILLKSVLGGSGITVTDDGIGDIVVSKTPSTVRAVTATTDTILATDDKNTVTYNSTSAIATTLPDNATTAGLVVGFTIDYAIINTGQVTFSIQGSDVLIFYSPTSATSPVTVGKGVGGKAKIVAIDGSNNRTWVVTGNFV